MNEVLLKVLLDKIKPNQKFSFVEEFKGVSQGGFAKLTSFKKIHYQKLMVSRIQANPKAKKIGKVADVIKRKTIENNCRTGGITKFSQNLAFFQRFIYCSVYIMDKICMVTLREMLDMKMLSDFLSGLFNKATESECREYTLMWFGSSKKIKTMEVKPTKETEGFETNEASDLKSTGSTNKYFRIAGNQESSQDQNGSIDNGSQLSDFSLKFNSVGRMSEDFFDF